MELFSSHKHNSLLLGPIQPSSPSTKELHDLNIDSISAVDYGAKDLLSQVAYPTNSFLTHTEIVILLLMSCLRSQ